MHSLRRVAFRALTSSPSTAVRGASTPAVSTFRHQLSFQSKFASIAFRRFASDSSRDADAYGEAVESADPAEQHNVAEAIDSASGSSRGYSNNNQDSLAGNRRGTRPSVPPGPAIYVGNLQFDVVADDLKKLFQEFGAVSAANVATDPRGFSKGFGYVTFDSVEAATSAINALDTQVFEGRQLVVNYQNQRTDRIRRDAKNPASKTLFIGNLPFEMTDGDLNKLFKDIPNIIDVRVAIDRRTGQPRGFAHADFTDVDSATRAHDSLRGTELYGRTLRLDYSNATVPRIGVPGSRNDGAGQGSDSGPSSF